MIGAHDLPFADTPYTDEPLSDSVYAEHEKTLRALYDIYYALNLQPVFPTAFVDLSDGNPHPISATGSGKYIIRTILLGAPATFLIGTKAVVFDNAGEFHLPLVVERGLSVQVTGLAGKHAYLIAEAIEERGNEK